MPSHRFLIAALSRSRTAWLANLLTWGDGYAYHDLTVKVGSMAEYRRVLASTPWATVGAVDTGLSLGRDFEPEPEDGPLVVVERPVHEVVPATLKAFPEVPPALVEEMVIQGAVGLERLRAHATLWVDWRDLDRAPVMEAIWALCRPDVEWEPWARRRWATHQGFRVVVDPARYTAGITPAAQAWMQRRVDVTEHVPSGTQGGPWPH